MYLKWNEKTITDFSEHTTTSSYNLGYLFGREKKGLMYQTRSVRINLENFSLSSENRRILKKTESLSLTVAPLPFLNYHWSIAKLAKDFYTTKFGDGTFSANKIKEILTEPHKSNFNKLLIYTIENTPVGYCIFFENKEIIHYCYPFYLLTNAPHDQPGAISYQLTATTPPNIGLGMMLRAIIFAKEQGKKYMYLGSASRPTDTYKLQFSGLEWFDGKEWQTDLEKLKNILNSLGGLGETAV